MNEQSGNSGQLQAEQQARNLLAAEYERAGMHAAAGRILAGNELGGDFRAIRAIVAALAARQPVGQEPVELTAAVQILRDSLCNNEPQWRALCIVLAAFPGGDAALLAPAPAAVPAVPSPFLPNERRQLVRDGSIHEPQIGYAKGWNACREAMLATHPQPAAAKDGDA